MKGETVKKIGDYFKSGMRANGDTFVSCTDDAPEWLKDAIRDAHGDRLPNNWVYATCRVTCDAIDEGSLTDDSHEFADGQVDVYTGELASWFADMCNSSLFAEAEENAKDLGTSGTVVEQLGLIQYCAIARIADIMREAVEQNAENDAA